MKRISSLGMGLDQRPLLVVSVVMSVAEGAAWHYGGKSSPLQPCWALTYLPFWYFIWLFTATEEWAARCWGEMRALKAAFSFLVNTESCWCATVGQRTTNTFFSEPTVGALIKDIHYLHRIDPAYSNKALCLTLHIFRIFNYIVSVFFTNADAANCFCSRLACGAAQGDHHC